MNLEDAWNILGRDLSDVVGEIRKSPVDARAEAAERELEKARSLARKLMGLHHPDKNPGDEEAAKRFMRVKTALSVIEQETASLREKMASRKERSSHAVFIDVRKS